MFKTRRCLATLFTEFRSSSIRPNSTQKPVDINDVVFDDRYISQMTPVELRQFLERRFSVHRHSKKRILDTEPTSFPLPPVNSLENETKVLNETLDCIANRFSENLDESLSSLRVISKLKMAPESHRDRFISLITQHAELMSFPQLARASNFLGALLRAPAHAPQTAAAQRLLLEHAIRLRSEWPLHLPSLCKLCSATAKLNVHDPAFTLQARALLLSEGSLEQLQPDDVGKASFFNARFVTPKFRGGGEGNRAGEKEEGEASSEDPSGVCGDLSEALAHLITDQVSLFPSRFTIRQLCDLLVGQARVSPSAAARLGKVLGKRLMFDRGSLRSHKISLGGAANTVAAHLWSAAKERRTPELEMVHWMLSGVRRALGAGGVRLERGVDAEALRRVVEECARKLKYHQQFCADDPLVEHCIVVCEDIIELLVTEMKSND